MVHSWTEGGISSPTRHATYQDSPEFGHQPQYMEPPASDGYKNDIGALSDAIDMFMHGEDRRLDDVLGVTTTVRPTVHAVKEYA
jgi:hypothetical protein